MPVGGAIRASLRGSTKERSARVPVDSTMDAVDIDGVVTGGAVGNVGVLDIGSGVVAAGSKKKNTK